MLYWKIHYNNNIEISSQENSEKKEMPGKYKFGTEDKLIHFNQSKKVHKNIDFEKVILYKRWINLEFHHTVT